MPLRQESTKSCRHTARKIPPAGPGSDLAVCVEPFSCLCLPGCFRHLVVQVSVQPKNCCGVGHQPRSTAGAPPESGPRTAARSAPRPGKPQGSPRLHGSHVCPGTGRGPCRALPQRYGNGWEGSRPYWDPPLPDNRRFRLRRTRLGQPAFEAKLLQAVRKRWSIPKPPPPGHGGCLGRGRQPYSHGPSRPQHDHLRSIAHQRLAAAWNKDCLCRLIGLSPQPMEMQSPCPRNPN